MNVTTQLWSRPSRSTGGQTVQEGEGSLPRDMHVCAEHAGFYRVCIVGRMEWLLGRQYGAGWGIARAKARFSMVHWRKYKESGIAGRGLREAC